MKYLADSLGIFSVNCFQGVVGGERRVFLFLCYGKSYKENITEINHGLLLFFNTSENEKIPFESSPIQSDTLHQNKRPTLSFNKGLNSSRELCLLS